LKQIEDLPQFHVSQTKQGETHSTGYIDYELQGTLDRMDGVTEGRGWLLLPERNCLIGDLSFVDLDAKKAAFFTSEEFTLNLTGSNLPYLDGRWQAYHVWMVVEPEWIWEKTLFHAVDATAEKYKATEVSIIDGQEVYDWIKIQRADGKGSMERYCPVYPTGGVNLPDAGPDGIIRAGWTHEHCALCKEHIDAGHYGYLDRGDHWVCESCYAKYVSVHDLSFLDSL
jgi:hypothetical protein